MSILDAWYHEQRVLYAIVSLAAMVIVGSLLGLLMDSLGCWLGVDCSRIRHHRTRVDE